jgi:hypothetical protein
LVILFFDIVSLIMEFTPKSSGIFIGLPVLIAFISSVMVERPVEIRQFWPEYESGQMQE